MAVRSGQVGAVLLVSDDRGYSRALGAAAAAGLTTVAVGINGSLEPSVHRWFWWGDVLSGRAVADARREGGGMWGRGREEVWEEERRGGMGRGEAWEERGGTVVGGEAWGEDGGAVVVGERVERVSADGGGARAGLLGVEDVGGRGGGVGGREERWTHGDGDEGEGEWRDGGVLRTSRSEESAGQWEGDGEEWVDDVWDEEWDEDEWEGEGDEEDARSPGNEDFSHRVFGRAGSESRPHGNL
ncbi:hypothetical protein CLOP_g1804 [Closterium sp. NIES-67]|nr:hypothetical protein CLOP_g1804 [Closterium sp. NIES-67]